MAFTSLLASCRMHDVEPWSYLRDLLCLLPDWPAHRLLELSPLQWTATAQLPEVQRALHDNVYRRLTLLGAPAAGG
ncbi:MAG: transposase domain-containing protein [Polyangiaceae bacterium]